MDTHFCVFCARTSGGIFEVEACVNPGGGGMPGGGGGKPGGGRVKELIVDVGGDGESLVDY
jgi:hypothetical protein